MLRLITILLVLWPLVSFADETQFKIDSLLEPVVQVRLKRFGRVGGSGTIIYSQKSRTFVITNYHTIEYALHNIGKENETREQVEILTFKYLDFGNIVYIKKFFGNIHIYDKDLDLAFVEIISDKEFKTARLPPADFKLKLFMEVYSVGFAKLKKVSANKGEITALNVKLKYFDYGRKAKFAITNGHIYNGYSGGAIFTAKDYLFVGIPQSVEIDWSGSPITWLATFVTIKDVRKFLIGEGLAFVLDESEPLKFTLKPEPKLPIIFKLEDFIRG